MPTERFRHHEGLGHTVPGVGLQVREGGGAERERDRQTERQKRDRQTGVGGVRWCCGEERKAVKDADQLNRL